MTIIALSFILSFGLIPIGLLIIWLNGKLNNLFYVPLIMLSLPLLVGIIWITFFLIRKRKFRKEQEILRELKGMEGIHISDRSIKNLQERLKLSKQNRELKETKREIEFIKYKGEISNRKCCISKIVFTSDDIIMQCPYCKSLFKEKYLTEWLMKNEICPVCRIKIIIRPVN